jgi:hypothetical protein
MSLSEDKIVNIRSGKTPTADILAERIRLPRVWLQKQNTSPTAGASPERIRLPSDWW